MPELPDEEERKAQAVDEAGRLDAEIALYEHRLATEVPQKRVYRHLWNLYGKTKRYDDIRRLLELAAKRWPGHRERATGTWVPSPFASWLARKLSGHEEWHIDQDGMALEREGRVGEAIARYEYGVANETHSRFTYVRLLDIYHKAKRIEDERRICELAASRAIVIDACIKRNAEP